MLPAGLSPVDYVVIFPDWNGSVTRELGIANVGDAAGPRLHRRGRRHSRPLSRRCAGAAARRILEEHGIEPGAVAGFRKWISES